ncbi:MAG: phosphatidylserine decarboxylase [Lachnospiraceae bacterium]|nr:phosphatidylserine decarboxylase [Lachnospiraceae bacterium]
MLVYNRQTKKLHREDEYGETTLRFLYSTVLGRFLLKLIVARPFFSRLRAKYQRSPKSKKDILPFALKYHIDMAEYEEAYTCFNDFFIRKRAIENHSETGDLVAVADSKLLVYKIDENLKVNVKHSCYTLQEILNRKINIESFRDGYCLVFRLSVSDCHRYYFIDDGMYLKRYRVKGLLHTIRPIAGKYRVFCRNQREVSYLKTENLGNIIWVEVGALLVGCIQNHPQKHFKKMEEKGYFEYGGSTILVFLRNNVKIDEDILKNSKKQIETKVKIGERIGKIIDSCN